MKSNPIPFLYTGTAFFAILTAFSVNIIPGKFGKQIIGFTTIIIVLAVVYFGRVSLPYHWWAIGLGGCYGMLPAGIFKKSSVAPDGRFHLETIGGEKIYFGDPKDNFLVYAGANAGKTKSIGKPLLAQYIQNGWAGLVMDYKDYDYTKTAYNMVQRYEYPHRFLQADFINLNYTNRFNPIKPKVLKEETFMLQLMDDILSASLPGEHNEWSAGGLGLLKGVGYRFFKDYPEYCTIPHIMNYIVQTSSADMETFLRVRPESKALASAFVDSSRSERTQAGYHSTLTNHISGLASNKKVQYVLTGDDFDFDLLNPADPKLLCVSNNYSIDSILSPIIALMTTVSSRGFALGNEVPFVYFFDEADKVKIRDYPKMVSVLREYGCSFTVLTQSGSQMEKTYGKLGRNSIESNFANVFLGRTKDVEALKNYGYLFSRREERRVSKTRGNSTNSTSSSVTVSTVKENRYDPYFFTELRQGEFVGSAAHSNFKEFHLRLKQYDASWEQDLPIVRMVLDSEVEQNYRDIINVVTNIIK